MFWSRIRTSIGRCKFSRCTAYSNNLTWFVLYHMGKKALNVAIRTMDVDVKHAEMILKRIVFKLASHRNTCILYHNIQLLTTLLKLINELVGNFVYILILRHIKSDNSHIFRILTRFPNPLKFSLISCRYYGIGTTLIKLIRQELSNTRWGSGYPYVFALVVGF